MNEVTLKLNLTFSDNLSKEEIAVVIENVLNGLVHTANTAGITPDSSDTFTETISVECEATGGYLGHDLITNQSI